MPPRIGTIASSVAKAIDQIESAKGPGCARALSTLETLGKKIGNAKGKKKAPNAYAKFVKEQYGPMSKKYPGLSAPEIMPKIAAAWRVTKKK